MINDINFYIKSTLAGIFIAMGAIVSLSIGWPIGPFLFSFGLIFIILTQTNLFTGKSGFTKNWNDTLMLPIMLLCNIFGCYLLSLLFPLLDTSAIVRNRLCSTYTEIFCYSILTGIIMTVAVYYAKEKNNWLPLLIGIPTFIFSGLPHCIADAFYYFNFEVSWRIIKIWLLSVAGNYVGCNFHRILNLDFMKNTSKNSIINK